MSGESVKEGVAGAEGAEAGEGTVGQSKPGGLPAGGGAPLELEGPGVAGEDGKRRRETGSRGRTVVHEGLRAKPGRPGAAGAWCPPPLGICAGCLLNALSSS